MAASPGTDECQICDGGLDPDESRAVADLVGSLIAGDIFHATSATGASLLCIVASVDAHSIFARRFITAEGLQFDRATGTLVDDRGNGAAWIDTVEPLPGAVHGTFLEMDRRYRLGKTFRRVRLTSAEIDALLSIGEYVKNHAFRQVEIDNRAAT